jgi:hypothetical protein
MDICKGLFVEKQLCGLWHSALLYFSMHGTLAFHDDGKRNMWGMYLMVEIFLLCNIKSGFFKRDLLVFPELKPSRGGGGDLGEFGTMQRAWKCFGRAFERQT